jgi:hypothetical protein
LDVHKATIAAAIAEAGTRPPPRLHGEIANTPAALARLMAKLSAKGERLSFVYEAGPCGMACIARSKRQGMRAAWWRHR